MAPYKRATPTQVINLIYIRAAIQARTGKRLSLTQVRQYLVEEGLITQRQANTKAPIFTGYADYFTSDDFAIEDRPSDRPTKCDLNLEWGLMASRDEDNCNVLDISYVYGDTQLEKASNELTQWVDEKLEDGLSITHLLGILEYVKLNMMMDYTEYDYEEEWMKVSKANCGASVKPAYATGGYMKAHTSKFGKSDEEKEEGKGKKSKYNKGGYSKKKK